MAAQAEVIEPDAASIEVVPSPIAIKEKSPEELAAIRLQAYEDQIFEASMAIVKDTLSFADIEPSTETAPDKWFDELGGDVDAVNRRMRVAKGAWMSSKDAPFALQAAKSVATQIIKARSTEKAAPRTLNVIAISVQTSHRYEEKEVE